MKRYVRFQSRAAWHNGSRRAWNDACGSGWRRYGDWESGPSKYGAKHRATPLNIQLTKLANLIGKIGFSVAGLAFAIFFIKDVVLVYDFASFHTFEQWLPALKATLQYFMMAVTLIVVAVPEGLPMSVTLSLALNMRRMLSTNNLVRKMHACETMGAITVICTDKTGTLTQNLMQVYEPDFTD